MKTLASKCKTMWGLLCVVTIIFNMNWVRMGFSYNNRWRSNSYSCWCGMNSMSNNTGLLASLMFDVFTLFLIGGIVNRFVSWLADFLRMAMTNLVWNRSCNWMAYLLWNCVAFRFVFSFIFCYGICLADSLRVIFTCSGIGRIINGVTFNNRFRMN